jgi:hypothetical protein
MMFKASDFPVTTFENSLLVDLVEPTVTIVTDAPAPIHEVYGRNEQWRDAPPVLPHIDVQAA